MRRHRKGENESVCVCACKVVCACVCLYVCISVLKVMRVLGSCACVGVVSVCVVCVKEIN